MSQPSRAQDALFREQAVSARQTRYMGRVLVHQPLGYTFASALALCFIGVIGAFLYFASYTLKARVDGVLMPDEGVLRVTATGAGVITHMQVFEGQHVQAGDTLFAISAERLSAAGATQQLIAEQLEQRLRLLERDRVLASDRLQEQLRALDQRLQAIDEELFQFQEERDLLKRREALAMAHLDRQQQLVAAGFVSRAVLQQAETELLTLQGQQRTQQRGRTSLRRERATLQAQREEAQLRQRSDLSDVDSHVAQLRQEQAENAVRTGQNIVAPFSGTITGVGVQPGQQVQSGALLASLIPEQATLWAYLYVGPRQAGFIEPGQPVVLRYAAYPFQKFGLAHGTVEELSKSPYAMQELPTHIASVFEDQPKGAQLFYRVKVKLDEQVIRLYGKPHSLQAGMLLQADIVRDRRRLYEWAFEPLYSISGR